MSDLAGLAAREAGRKDDHGKLRWDLLPWVEIEEVVKVLTHGAHKYGDNNWQQVSNGRGRYLAATVRHFVAWIRGERTDPDSGCLHLAMAITNLLFLLWFDRHDTKKKPVQLKLPFGEVDSEAH